VEDERLLLERAKEYDQAALGELYDRYGPRIYSYIYYRLGDTSLAEDLTAQVFLRMLEAIRASRPWRDSFSGWLYRIAHNLIVDHFRRQAQEGCMPLEEQLVAAEDNTAEAVEKRLTRRQLRAAINRLSEDQAQVVVLRFVEGLSSAEIARIMGKSEGAIRALQYRAIVNLRRFMEEDGDGRGS